MSKARLRRLVLESLTHQGLRVRDGLIAPPSLKNKNRVRQLHSEAVKSRIERAAPGLRRYEDDLLSYIANGREVLPETISPRLVLVRSGSDRELLFRYARLHWSIPVSAGYGRRLRYLVIDESNDKLMGIIGLGDPVGALKPRDEWIGWDSPSRRQRLRHVIDAFVLGAVPPYSQLLCGKLVALLASSNQVRDAFKRKYHGGRSLIKRRRQDGRLALITTASALGRSSTYNRLRFGNKTVFLSAGYTRGSGEFHFSNGLYRAITEHAHENCTPTAKHGRWGSGFRNRREIVRKTLLDIGLSPDLVYHGIQRELFVVPMAKNSREFLRGEENRLQWFDRPASDLVEWFKERWMLPRAEWDNRYRDFVRGQYRLWQTDKKRK